MRLTSQIRPQVVVVSTQEVIQKQRDIAVIVLLDGSRAGKRTGTCGLENDV